MASHSFVTADLDVLTTFKDVKRTIDIIAKCIIDYNCHHTYNALPMGKKYQSNCQDFVEDLLFRLGIQMNFTGPLGDYLNTIKQNGSSKMIFKPENQFSETFQLKEKFYEFSNHESLDIFVRNLIEKDSDFQKHYKLEYALLKTFDRAFWLKHFGDKNLLNYRCFTIDPEEPSELDISLNLDNGNGCGCPFQDPRETNSIIQGKSFKGLKLL
jgi:hypothetical protein